MPHGQLAGAAVAPPATTSAVPIEPVAMWTRSDDKLLEMLVVRHFPPQWDMIASRLVGKTPEQAKRRYESTVAAVTHALQALHVETPRDWDMQTVMTASSSAATAAAGAVAVAASAGEEAAPRTENKARVPVPPSSAANGETSEPRSRKRKCGGDRKKPEKWTEEEHRLFLAGLAKYGKGKWKQISSKFLPTKSASQIASHNQKYRRRVELRKRNGCKRASIHDITELTTSAAAAVAADGGGAVEEFAGRDDPGGGGAVEEFPGQDDLGTLLV